MTRPEPATADAQEVAHLVVLEWTRAMLDKRCAGISSESLMRELIATAITAAESRAMERCAEIAEGYLLEKTPEEIGEVGAAANDIAAAIRSSINPPGEEE